MPCPITEDYLLPLMAPGTATRLSGRHGGPTVGPTVGPHLTTPGLPVCALFRAQTDSRDAFLVEQSGSIHAGQEVFVCLGRPHLVQKQFHSFGSGHGTEGFPEHKYLVQSFRLQQKLLFSRSGLVDVDGRLASRLPMLRK